jgi:hypothetical protein
VIGKSEIGQSLIGEFITLPANADCLASVCGRRAGKVERRAERRRERSRSATLPPNRRRKPAAVAANPIAARDERDFCEAEQAWSQEKWGDRQACEVKQKLRWSRRIRIAKNHVLTLAATNAGTFSPKSINPIRFCQPTRYRAVHPEQVVVPGT